MQFLRVIHFLSSAVILSYPVFCTEIPEEGKLKCDKVKEALVPKVCPSCRDNCNETNGLLRNGERTQMCKCDKECILYSDCCSDFATECRDMHSEAQRKYAGHSLNFYCKGDIKVLQEWIPEPSVTLHTTTTSRSSTIEVASTGWITYLLSNTGVIEDKAEGLMKEIPNANYELFMHDPNIEWHDLILHLSAKRYQIFDGHLDFMDISFHNFTLLHKRGRSCMTKFDNFLCSSCSEIIFQKLLCRTAFLPVHFNGTENAQELNRNVEECVKEEQSVTSPPFMATATFQRFPDQGVFRLLSDELPWKVLLCSMRRYPECEIVTCAKGRLLSHDGRSCFIPNTVSIFLILNTTMSTPLLSRNGHTGFQMVRTQFHVFNESKKKIPAPPYVCLGMNRLLRNQTKWKFGHVIIRPLCRFEVRVLQSRSTRMSEGAGKNQSPTGNKIVESKQINHDPDNNQTTNLLKHESDSVHDVEDFDELIGNVSMDNNTGDNPTALEETVLEETVLEETVLEETVLEETVLEETVLFNHMTNRLKTPKLKQDEDVYDPWILPPKIEFLDTNFDLFREMISMWGLEICLQKTISGKTACRYSNMTQPTGEWVSKEDFNDEKCINPFLQCFTYEIIYSTTGNSGHASSHGSGRKCFLKLYSESLIIYALCCFITFAFY